MLDPVSAPKQGASIVDYVVYLLGVVLLTWAIASVWLGMRTVMDLGGYCASGGPYQIQVECPDSVSLIMFLAFPLGFLGAGLMVWKGDALGKGFGSLVGLAWPALFLSLGFNFLQFGVAPPDGSHDIVWGWLIPGVIFVLMGGFPLLGLLKFGDHTMVMPGVAPRPTPKNYAELARALREAAQVRAAGGGGASGWGTGGGGSVGSRSAGAAGGGSSAGGADAPPSLVDDLERLARLHSAGSITNVEYDQAKRALIDSASHAGAT